MVTQFEEGIVRIFDVSIEGAETFGKVTQITDVTTIVQPVLMRVAPFTSRVQNVIDSARVHTCRVVGYVRSDSEGFPSLGIKVEPNVIIDLPSGPGYHKYQELMVISQLDGRNPLGPTHPTKP